MENLLGQINNGGCGGKNPSLIGAGILIDDYIDPSAQEELGFIGIKVPGEDENNAEGWVDSVLSQLKISVRIGS